MSYIFKSRLSLTGWYNFYLAGRKILSKIDSVCLANYENTLPSETDTKRKYLLFSLQLFFNPAHYCVLIPKKASIRATQKLEYLFNSAV